MPEAGDAHGARIIVVGSLMMDLVVRAPRLPAIGESLFGHDFATFTGGKGANHALAAARLGAEQVSMIGRTGDDEFGRRIVEALESEGVDCRGVIRDRRHGTGVAIPIVFDDGRNSIISIPQANLALSAADIRAMAELVTSADMLLVQFEVGLEATAEAVRVARDAGVPVLLNAAPIGLHAMDVVLAASHLVANEVEAAALAPAAHGDHVQEVRLLLGEREGSVAVTLGEEGALVGSRSGIQFVAPFQVHAVDSVGAGDAFCAAYAIALASGRDAVSAARFASAAGALAVTKAGAQAALPTREAVDALLRDSP